MTVTSRPLSSDPLRNFKFNVLIGLPNIGSIPNGPAGAAPGVAGPYWNNQPSSGWFRLGFMQCGGIGLQVEPLTYREGGDNLTHLPLDAPVLTINGWKTMREIEIGDRVIDPYGEDSKVTEKSQVTTRPVYAVTLGDGVIAEASDQHVWEVEVHDTNKKRIVVRVSTEDLKKLVDNSNRFVHIGVVEPFEFDVESELPIDPYLLGLLLAEGSLENEGVSFAHGEDNEEILGRVIQYLPSGHELKPKYDNGKLSAWRISVGNDGPGARNVYGRDKVLSGVRQLGLIGHRAWEKFVPEVYKYASQKTRLAVLQGIMDGDGWVDEGHCTQFSSTSKQLAEDVQFLIRSLGGRCKELTHTTNRMYVLNGGRRQARATWSFSGISDFRFIPFTMDRKVSRFQCSDKTSSQFRRIRSVELVGEKEVQCIEVSASSHLFVHANVFSSNTRKLPGQTDFNPVTLSRGEFPTDNDNWGWMNMIFSAMYGNGLAGTAQLGTPPDFRTNVYINVLEHPNTTSTALGNYNSQALSSSGTVINTQTAAPGFGGGGVGGGSLGDYTYPDQKIVVLSFKLYSAWIGSLAYSDLDAGGNAVGIEQMTLNYEGFDMWWGNGSYIDPICGW